MNIQTVAENLKKTIAGKEQMLAQYRTMTLVLRQDESPEIYATVKFLEINIDELKRILQDVEQCEPSLPGEGNNYEKWDGDE
jgi:hypothetical protein